MKYTVSHHNYDAEFIECEGAHHAVATMRVVFKNMDAAFKYIHKLSKNGQAFTMTAVIDL